jgi:hypothetical protein
MEKKILKEKVPGASFKAIEHVGAFGRIRTQFHCIMYFWVTNTGLFTGKSFLRNLGL